MTVPLWPTPVTRKPGVVEFSWIRMRNRARPLDYHVTYTRLKNLCCARAFHGPSAILVVCPHHTLIRTMT